ncbi:MAG: signal recognition particle protein [Candidatus Caenarcaniphilales bacterium]|nr:signal recognition particle protein [Candidatus Caenarcaniphilales bacterium]
MFENLTDRLQGVLQKVSGTDRLTAETVDAALIEVRKALIEADVSLKVIKIFLDRIRRSAIGEKVATGITPSQKFIQIVHQELTRLLGGEQASLNYTAKPSLILLLGLQGAGKTTTAAKLGLTLQKQGRRVLMVALDLQRPAAIQQLQTLGTQIGISVFADFEEKDVLGITEHALNFARAQGLDTLILDTAGRLQIDSDLMAELLLLERKFNPAEKLLVIDSLVGQQAAEIVETFNQQIGITGAILTKLDGDSRGGSALSIVEGAQVKIKFVGLGEKIEPLEGFDPERMAGRILGFGDIVALVRAAEEKFDKLESAEIEKRLKKGDFNFELFLQMQKMMSKLGSLSQIFGMLGMNSMLQLNKDDREELLEQGQIKMKRYEYAIQSMTQAERRNPEILNPSRIKRIALGSGLQIVQVEGLVKEFQEMKKVFQLIGPAMRGGNLNPAALSQISQKAARQDKSKKNGPFGGGAFMRF